MSLIECPSCNKETITFKQKLLAGKWVDIYCTNCNSRFCDQPIVLALMHFIVTWNILFFGYMAFRESSIAYAAAMFIGWFILEFFIYYIPLTRLRSKKPQTENNTPK